MRKRLHALQSLKNLLFICLQKKLSNLCPRNENTIFKVKFSLDETNNRLDITGENISNYEDNLDRIYLK